MTAEGWAFVSIGCVLVAGIALVVTIRADRRMQRALAQLQGDVEVARIARTSQLVLPSEVEGQDNGVQVAFALYAAAANSPFELSPGVRIRYWGPSIIGKHDKPRNVPLR